MARMTEREYGCCSPLSGEACMGHTSGEQNTVGECPHTLAAHCMLGGLGDPHEHGAASRHYSHREWDAS